MSWRVISLADELYQRAPVAVKRCAVIDTSQCGSGERVDILIFIKHVLIVLDAHIVVGDGQFQRLTAHATYGQHAIVVEQADEVVIVHDSFGREMADDSA